MSNRRDVLKQFAALASTITSTALLQSAGNRAKGQGSARPKIKMGQIGVGHAHASKLAVYRASSDYEVVGIVEADATLRAKAEADPIYQGLPWLTQEQLLSTRGVRAVLVETQVRNLLSTAEACIAAGKNVHLDKPAGESLSQYRKLLETAAQKKLLVQMGYMYRYNPAVVLLRECLRRGWLGDPFEVHAVMSKVIAPDARAGLAEYPGGTMFELGCHVIDLVVDILGAPDKVTPYSRHSSTVKDSLQDNMLAVFEYPRCTATVRSTGLEVEGFARRQLTVCGSKGTLHIQPLDEPSVRLALSEPHGDYKRGYQDVTFPKFTRYVGDAADMARIIRIEKLIDFSYEHDLDVQTAVLQASGVSVDG